MRQIAPVQTTALWLGIVAAVACRGPVEVLRPVAQMPPVNICTRGCVDSLSLTYLGSSGFILRSGDHAILTGPLLSNPSMWRLFGPLKSRSNARHIDSVLAAHPVHDAAAILVGHSHYDHLMDVPYVARHHARRAIIYGPPSMGHILHGDSTLRPVPAHGDSGRYRVIDPMDVGTVDRTGRWFSRPGSPFRFMALAAEHAPNFGEFSYAKGTISQDLAALPDELAAWKLGESYAYVIELRHPDGSTAFRVYYMDAVSRPPLGLPPRTMTDSAAFDAIIVAAGNYEKVKDYPTALIRAMCPRLTILAHWEDFFRSQTREPKLIPLLEPRELVRRVESMMPRNGQWVTPRPGAVLRLCRCR